MIEQLLKYQEVDAKLRKIEVELSGNEDRKKAIVAKKYLEGVEETLEKLEARAAELASAYERVSDDLERMKEASEEFATAFEGANELGETDYLLKRTEKIQGIIKNLSAEANKISEEMKKVLKDYSELKTNTQTYKAQLAECGKKYNELKDSKKDEMDKIKAELEVIKKTVDPSLMARYEEKRKEKIFPIVVEAREQYCGACNMELPMAATHKLKSGEVIDCDQCKRMIYAK